MRKASQIADDINAVLDHISDLRWQLAEAQNRFRLLQKEFEHHLKFKTINQNEYDNRRTD